MKKYLTIFRLAITSNVEYRWSLFLRIARYTIGILLVSLVWLAINAATPIKEISQSEIIRYYFLTAIMYSLSNFHTDNVEEDIRLGYISQYLVKPVSAYWFYFLNQASIAFIETIIKAIIMLPILFWMSHGLPWSLPHILLFALMLPLIFFMVFTLYFALSLTAFWFQAVESLRMSVMFIFRFLSGIYVPLLLLPPAFVAVSHWLPFAQTAFFPIQFLEGKLSWNEGVLLFVVICGWSLLFFIIEKILWHKATHAYESTGI